MLSAKYFAPEAKIVCPSFELEIFQRGAEAVVFFLAKSDSCPLEHLKDFSKVWQVLDCCVKLLSWEIKMER